MNEDSVFDKIQKVMMIGDDLGSGGHGSAIKEETPRRRGELVDVLIGEFGGFSIAMGAIKTAASCAEKLFPQNRIYQNFTRIVGSSIPVLMTAHRTIQIVKNYLDNKRRSERPIIDEENFIISHILDIDMERSYADIASMSKKDMPIIHWMQTMPNTNAISSIVMFDRDFNVVEDLRKRKHSLSEYYIVHEFNCEDGNIRFILKCRTDLLGDFSNDACMIYDGRYYRAFIMVLMNYAYIESLDYKSNLITIRDSIETSPRRKIDHEVYQLSDDIRTEIRKSIDKGKKRGYAIAGLPGTGKSTMVDKIIDEFRDIPAISIPCECHVEHDVIRNALIMSQLVSPCIVIFEDIDSLPLGDKYSPHLATFIEFLDSAKYNNPVIFIATMNEPENIHESLMDRRGRFDKVILVDPPTMKEDIMEVMSNVYNRELGEAMPADMLDEQFFDIASKCGMRHSDYAEIVNRVMINDMPLVSGSFTSVAMNIRDTQNAVDRFKVRRRRRDYDDYIEEMCDEPVECEVTGHDWCEDKEYSVDDGCDGISVGIGIGV